MLKYIMLAVLFTVIGGTIGAFGTDYQFRTNFEAISGVNWHSFNAAHDDCVVAWQEQCKIFGGFAPLSQFK